MKDVHNNLRMNNVKRVDRSLKSIASANIAQKNQFPRHIPKICPTNSKQSTPEQYTKVILDLKFENEQDYDDSQNYNNNRAKRTNSLINDCNLNIEIESNSKPVTKTLSESLERKRCIQKKLGSRRLQQPEKIFSESNEDEKISKLICKDCKLLKPNTNPETFHNSYRSNSELKQINDDFFINILKQLIDKLDKSKQSKSLSRNDLLIQKSNDLFLLETKSNEKSNYSSSEELIHTFEKMKENCTIDNPENTFVNGKRVRNKIEGIHNYERKPVINDISTELVYYNESALKDVMNSFGLINLKNQQTETNPDISENLNILKVTGTQENEEVSTSPIPGNNKHFLVTRETPKPLFSSSTLKNKLDSTRTDDNNKWKFKTTFITNLYEEPKKIPTNKTNIQNQESTISNFETTSNEDIISDKNNKLKTENFDEIVESSIDENDRQSKNNKSEEVDSILVQKENNSSKNKLDCSHNKKIVKNILSSTIMKNSTEIRTDTYTSPKNLKIKSQKWSNQSPKTNGESIKENNTFESSSIKTKNDLDLDLLEKNILLKNRSPDLKFEDQRKIENNKRIKSIPLTPKTLAQKNPRQFVTQLKQDISRKPHTYLKNSFRKFSNNNKTNINNIIPTTNRISKVSDHTQNKITGQFLPQSVSEKSKGHDDFDVNRIKMPLKKVVTKLKYDVPINSNTHTENFSRYDSDAVMMDKKMSPMILSPVKSINIPLSKNMSKPSKLLLDYSDVDVIKKIPRKFVVDSYVNKTVNENVNNKKKNLNSRNNTLVLVKNIENIKIHTKPKYTLEKISNGPTHRKRINIDRTTLQTDKSKPTQVIRTPKPSSPLRITSPKQNNDAISKYKIKYPLNDRKIKDTIVSSISNENLPIEKYDILDNPDLTLKNKKSFNDRKIMESDFIKNNKLSPNLKYVSDSDVLSHATFVKVPQIEDDYDYEHAPYKHDDLEPIIFNEPIGKPKLPNQNSRLFLQHPSRQPLFGNQFKNTPASNLLNSVPIIRSEYDDYPHALKKNNGEEINIEKQLCVPELNLSSHSSNEDNTSISDSIKYGVNNLDKKYLNQSRFEILPSLKVDNGVFKIPLSGHTGFDNNNGSEYVSDIIIPIEKSNGQHSAISLTKLLSGDFHLLNRDDEHSLAVGLTSNMDSPLSASQTSHYGTNSDKTGRQYDAATLKTFYTNDEDEKKIVPIHIIQIINNGMCSNDGTKTEKKTQRNRNNNSRKLRNEGKRVSSAGLQKLPKNLREINKKLNNAYKHFDSEILDRFLQVYSPHIV